jgi:hypothetical protein
MGNMNEWDARRLMRLRRPAEMVHGWMGGN